MSKLEVRNISNLDGETDLELGEAGNTVTLASGANAMGFGHSTSVALNYTVSLPQSQFVKITYNSVQDDLNGWWDAGFGRFIPTLPGGYLMMGSWKMDGCSGQANHNIRVNKNFSSIFEHEYATSETAPTGNFYGIVQMNGTTDYLELYLKNGASGTVTTSSGTDAFTPLNRVSFIKIS